MARAQTFIIPVYKKFIQNEVHVIICISIVIILVHWKVLWSLDLKKVELT